MTLRRLIKPGYFLKVNRAHPLARSIAAFHIYAPNGSFWDAVTGKPGATVSGQTTARTVEGTGLHFNGSARSSNTNFTNPGAVTNNLCTVIARIRLTTKATAVSMAAHYCDASGHGPCVGFDLNGFAVGGYSGTNGLSTGDFTGDAVNHAGLGFVTIGASIAYGAGFAMPTGAAAQPRAWINGIRQTDGAGSGSLNSTNVPTQLTLGRDASGYYSYFTGDIAWVLVFNRLLTDAEHKAIAAAPFALLRQAPEVRAYLASSGASPNVSLTSASTTAGAASLTANVSPLLSLAATTAAVSAVTPQPATSLVAGASSGTASSISIEVDAAPSLPASSATATAAGVTAKDSESLTSAAIASATGAINEASQVSLSASSASAAVEPFSVERDASASLSGMASSASAYGFTPNESDPLGATAATSAATALVSQLSPAIGAASSATGTASLTSSVITSLSSAPITAAPGILSIPGKLPYAAVTAAVEAFNTSTQVALSAASAVASVASIVSQGATGLLPASVIAAAQSIVGTVQSALGSAAAFLGLGAFGKSEAASVSGTTAAGAAGYLNASGPARTLTFNKAFFTAARSRVIGTLATSRTIATLAKARVIGTNAVTGNPMQAWTPKTPDDAITYPVGFVALLQTLPTGTVIQSATCEVSVHSGTDPNPSAMLSGSAAVNSQAVTINNSVCPIGSVILQKVIGGVAGCTYFFTFEATCSDGSVFVEQRSLYVTEFQ